MTNVLGKNQWTSHSVRTKLFKIIPAKPQPGIEIMIGIIIETIIEIVIVIIEIVIKICF